MGLLSAPIIGSFGESLFSGLKRPIKYACLNNQLSKARPAIVNINSQKSFLSM